MKILPRVLATLAVIGTLATDAGSPIGRASAQVPPPATLTGIFAPDIAEVLRPEQLKAAADNAKGEGKWKGDGKCYPPSALRAKFTAFIPKTGDPLFLTTLGNARAEAIAKAMKDMGVDPSQFTTTSESGENDDVRVTYDEFADTDPPVFYK